MKNVRPELFRGQLHRRVSGNHIVEILFADHSIPFNFDATEINSAIMQVQAAIRWEIDDERQTTFFDQIYVSLIRPGEEWPVLQVHSP